MRKKKIKTRIFDLNCFCLLIQSKNDRMQLQNKTSVKLCKQGKYKNKALLRGVSVQSETTPNVWNYTD